MAAGTIIGGKGGVAVGLRPLREVPGWDDPVPTEFNDLTSSPVGVVASTTWFSFDDGATGDEKLLRRMPTRWRTPHSKSNSDLSFATNYQKYEALFIKTTRRYNKRVINKRKNYFNLNAIVQSS